VRLEGLVLPFPFSPTEYGTGWRPQSRSGRVEEKAGENWEVSRRDELDEDVKGGSMGLLSFASV
jgi:hypothetical protein